MMKSGNTYTIIYFCFLAIMVLFCFQCVYVYMATCLYMYRFASGETNIPLFQTQFHLT